MFIRKDIEPEKRFLFGFSPGVKKIIEDKN